MITKKDMLEASRYYATNTIDRYYNGNCSDEIHRAMVSAFIGGAMWANRSIWHEPDDYPNEYKGIIEVYKCGSYYDTRRFSYMNKKNWKGHLQEYANCMAKPLLWCYASDLIPMSEGYDDIEKYIDFSCYE